MTSIDTGVVASPAEVPKIRKIGRADLRDALRKGFDDFSTAPTHVIFLTAIYPAIGLVLFRATFQYNLIPLLFPIISGFAILGPFAAIGLYEISRLREQGKPVTWRNALDVIHARSIAAILMLGAALVGLFVAWLGAAYFIYTSIFGDVPPASLGAFVDQIFGTRDGMKLLIAGNLVGFFFAVTAFAVSVVSFPMLIDRHTDAVTAATTSIRAVTANPMTMIEWGILVTGALVVGSLPLLMGLPIVVPILGHATWHLYRKLVV